MARMAHNRAAGEAETAVRPAAPVPVRANGMPRLGPKARALAAKAALAKAGAGDVAPRPVRGPAAGPKSSQAVVFASVRGPRRVVEAPSLKMAEGDVAPGAVPVPAPTPVVTDDDPGSRSGVGPRAEKRLDRAAKANDASNYVVAPTVNPAQLRPRHYGVIALFVLCVIVPTLSYSWYLWTRAADQYESDVGFGSRTEEAPSTFDFLGALGGSAQSGSKDMDILNQFIISQELVAKIDTDLDLKAIWSKADNDPLNGFYAAGTIEDLVAYWQRMVLVNYDNGTGLMNLQVFAFDPVDAQKIASAVLTESTNIINQLSKTAQDDTTRYSKESLAATEAKLAEARLAVLDFQVRNNIVDPSNVVANQLSVVATLNQQLASTQIDFDMLSGTVPATDPRLAQLSRRLEVIRNRIKIGRAQRLNSSHERRSRMPSSA